MANSRLSVTRREFMIGSAALANSLAAKANSISVASSDAGDDFRINQQHRRQELWSLLGDLPWDHKPAPPQLVRTEKHDGYTLQRWILDLNGIEPVPALLLIPEHRQNPAPGLLFMHWSAGQYELGKEQLLQGVDVQPAYAPVCAEKGLVTLAIDSWDFGERRHEANGHQGEEDAFKEMLWRGRVLWGMMIFDEFRAFDFLAGRPEVDPSRLGAFGMSMGATKAWWLAALEPRVHLTMDVCCLTDFESLIQAHNLSAHGVYYFVPSLLKHFDTAQINALIAPRAHLSVNGRKDKLTPPAGVEKIRDELMPLYRSHGREEDLQIELFDCTHQELPEMRELILKWMDRYLVAV